jgi:hypothetical protein
MIINRNLSGGSSVKKWIELFCRKHPYFGIPNLMKYITIANAVLWLLNAVNSRILPYMVFSPYWILRGQVWRLISFVFIPPSTGILAFIAFYFYYFLGSTLEQQWGTARFNLYFFSGVVLTILFGFLIYWITGVSVSLTAYYLFLSMFFSFAVLFPDMQVLLFFVIPVKMKWLAILDALFFLYGIFTTPFPANLVPVVAILNFFLFCGEDLLAMLGVYKKSANTISFQRAAREIRRKQAASLYHHKCAVCGKTDTDYPDLEFRYCSKCAGYHCFCQEHINSHIHFKE